MVYDIPQDTYPKIIIDDIRDVLPNLPDESIDIVATSPPYWQQRDYDMDGQVGLEEEVDLYVEELVDIFGKLRSVLDDDGVVFLNIGDKYVDKDKQMIPYRVAGKLQESGWAIRNVICWYKTNHMPSSIKDRFTNTWEPIFMLVKDDKDYYVPPRYYFNIDNVRVPHETEGTAIPSPKEVFSEEEQERLSDALVSEDVMPYEISQSLYNKLPDRLRTKGSTEYRGKFEDEKEINKGQSPGARQSTDGLYYSEQRKHDPDEESVIQFLRDARDKTDYTIGDIDDHFGYSHTAGHWFRLDEGGRSLPSPEDWMELKSLLGFDDRFDEEMTETHFVLQGVRKHPGGKNPGDMWQMPTANVQDAHFAPFPEDLPRRCIKSSCPEDGVVLDPFAGSGTTGKVAQELGRRSIMVDLNPDYESIMEDRFSDDANLSKFG